MFKNIIILVLLTTTLVFGWLYTQSQSGEGALQNEIDMLNQHIAGLEQQIVQLEQDKRESIEESVGTAVDETSQAIMDVWRSALDAVKEELKEFEDALQPDGSESDEQSHQNESHQQQKSRT